MDAPAPETADSGPEWRRVAPPSPERYDAIYVIGCFAGIQNGFGGHYHSLRDTLSALDLRWKVVVIGDSFPPALQGVENVELVRCRRGRAWSFPYAAFARAHSAGVVHGYDQESAPFAGFLARALDAPLVITKPGGRRLHRLETVYRNMIVFHQGDVDDLSAKASAPANLALIPHRVPDPDLSARSEPDPFEGLPEAALNIAAIGRVVPVYEEKIAQAIALRALLADRLGAPVNLSVIGVVNDVETLARLRALAGDDPCVAFRGEPEITHKAVRHLARADAAVATGRGFMEALAFGRYAFFTVKDERLPCFADAPAYARAFEENFSPRVTRGPEIDPEASIERFLETFARDRRGEGDGAYRAWAQEMFVENHSVAVGAQRLKAFYARDLPREPLGALWLAAARGFAASSLLKLLRGK